MVKILTGQQVVYGTREGGKSWRFKDRWWRYICLLCELSYLAFLFNQALREGGVAGVVEGLAPLERRLPPSGVPGAEDGMGKGCEWLRFACLGRAERVLFIAIGGRWLFFRV